MKRRPFLLLSGGLFDNNLRVRNGKYYNDALDMLAKAEIGAEDEGSKKKYNNAVMVVSRYSPASNRALFKRLEEYINELWF